MENLFNKLLAYYSISLEEYQSLTKPISEIKLPNPKEINGMDKVVLRINNAIKNKEKIIVYGDYDCDGICATTIMIKTFEKLNYNAAYYIPSRYIDGNGLNIINVNKIAKAGYKLIICVDNGISANDAIEEAKKLGVDVIIIDHHEPSKELPDAKGIIHPTICKIGDVIGSGGCMSLFVSAALLGKYDDYLITLAGLSTISDLMELKSYNRDLVRLAIDNLSRYRYLPLRLLTEKQVINEKSFSLEIAPKINAIGRVIEDTTINRLVKYLLNNKDEEIFLLKEWINDINEERKLLTIEAINTLPSIDTQKGICLLTTMKEGLIGLMCNKLLQIHNVPVIIFTKNAQDNTLLKGSIRSKNGFNVSKAFKSLEKYIINGGGHALAGGLEIKASDFDLFKNEFIELCSKHQFIEDDKENIEISISDINLENYEIVNSFSPFGMGFNEPTFIVKNLPTKNLKFTADEKHLSTSLTMKTKLLGFNMNQSEVKSHQTIDIIGTFNLNEFKGIKTLEYRIQKYK
ncbi:MAG: DHH family phosphoesterase [Bacilli bacterium]|nr:DHH family phosphoesterase [Bacilli bacterium]